MGSIKVRHSLLTKKLKRADTRLLVIDDNQLRYNQILHIFNANHHQVDALLLDDLKSFEKQLHFTWDIIIFGRAYDLKIEQALSLIQASKHLQLPILLLKPEDYQDENYQNYISKGIYDVVDLTSAQHFYISAIRGLQYSRMLQSEQKLHTELETVYSQARSLVQESRKAVALLQEGIHIQANQEYASLFGFEKPEDVLGLPLLDILRPKDLVEFKQRFKKITQGISESTQFDIFSMNPAVPNESLKLEFVPVVEEDAIQLNIDCLTGGINTSSETKSSLPPTTETPPLQAVYHQIQRVLNHQPANANAIVVLALKECPKEVFEKSWETADEYFSCLQQHLMEQINLSIYKINMTVYALLLQAESETVLTSKLIGLRNLEKPQLLTIKSKTYQLHLKLGYTNIDESIANEKNWEQLIQQAFTQNLPTLETHTENDTSETQEVKLETFTLDIASQAIPLTLLQTIKSKLTENDIHIKYQQLYDKYDSSIHTYEVSSGLIYDNQWIDLDDLVDLNEDPDLSIQLDRWILVEACKHLHHFITQYPDAKLIVNLNAHILLNDNQFPELVSKLLTIIGSKQKYPLVLQFSEESLQKNLNIAKKQTPLLLQHGAEISIRHFGNSIYSESVLQQTDVQYISFHEKFTQMLNSDKETTALQDKILNFMGIKPIHPILSHLDDMNLFASAWNVEARFLQGNYFQKKLDRLTDVQDQ